jgi:hypothetical protein
MESMKIDRIENRVKLARVEKNLAQEQFSG